VLILPLQLCHPITHPLYLLFLFLFCLSSLLSILSLLMLNSFRFALFIILTPTKYWTTDWLICLCYRIVKLQVPMFPLALLPSWVYLHVFTFFTLSFHFHILKRSEKLKLNIYTYSITYKILYFYLYILVYKNIYIHRYYIFFIYEIHSEFLRKKDRFYSVNKVYMRKYISYHIISYHIR